MAFINDFYDSPVSLIQMARDGMECQIKDGMLRVASKFIVDIDERKLREALLHDKHRYSDAYHAGYRQAIHDISEAGIDVHILLDNMKKINKED